MAPDFAPPSAAGGGSQGPADGDLDAAFLQYVSEFLHNSAAAPSIASPALNDAPSPSAGVYTNSNSNGSNSSNDSGSGGRGGAGDEAKLERQRVLAAKRRRAYRERSGAELQALRQQAAALSEQLEALTNHKAAENREAADLIPSCTMALATSEASSRTASVWRELAFRQREGRLAAEQLRRRLKTQVATRQAFIRDIGSSLSQRAVSTSSRTTTAQTSANNISDQRLIEADSNASALVLGSGNASTVPVPDLNRIELADASLIETYLDELDEAYAKTDEVLRDSGLAGQPDETRHQHITRKENGCYEIVDSLVVPFRFETMRAIMWDAVVRVHARADRVSYPSVRDPSNTVAVKFALQCRPRDGDHESESGVPLVIILVLRRYVELTREVFVWRAFSEGMGAVAGLSSDETGWSIARGASMSHDSSFSADATTNQTVVRLHTIRVHPLDSSSDDTSGAAATGAGRITALFPDEDMFAKLIASSADEDGELVSRVMEKFMLSNASVEDKVQSG